MDIAIFTLLKRQVIEVFIFLLATRRFAAQYGSQNEVERINTELTENMEALKLVNEQLARLRASGVESRVSFFQSIRNVA